MKIKSQFFFLYIYIYKRFALEYEESLPIIQKLKRTFLSRKK